MTDETREQIKSDALRWSDRIGSDKFIEGFTAGATHQHPIAEKAGYNQGLDDAINVARTVDLAFIVEELEALKR